MLAAPRRDVDDAPGADRGPCAGRRAGSNVNAASTLNLNAAYMFRELVWGSGRGSHPPALFTSTSTRPSRADRRVDQKKTGRELVGLGDGPSAATTALRPSARILSATTSRSAWVRDSERDNPRRPRPSRSRTRRRCPDPHLCDETRPCRRGGTDRGSPRPHAGRRVFSSTALSCRMSRRASASKSVELAQQSSGSGMPSMCGQSTRRSHCRSHELGDLVDVVLPERC